MRYSLQNPDCGPMTQFIQGIDFKKRERREREMEMELELEQTYKLKVVCNMWQLFGSQFKLIFKKEK